MHEKLASITGTPMVPLLAMIIVASSLSFAENIDPTNDNSQYAWAENIGWVNAEPNGDGGNGIQVGDSELSGWMWGENTGWISLSCKNRLSCATTDYGVLNDGNGVLSGHAWAENVGWINFAPSTSGVTIDPATGEFNGYAWGENVGWISFNCLNTATCGDVDYKMMSGWVCSPLPPTPSGSPDVEVDEHGSEWDSNVLSWNLLPGATGTDIVYGGLNCLHGSAGDFSSCTTGCLDNNRTTTSLLHTASPVSGDGFWYVVRGQNCGGGGTYGGALRDAGINASGNDCP